MRFLKNWTKSRQPQPAPRRHARLGVETLEARDLLAASPLPVLMVLADQRDFYYQEYADTRQSVATGGISVAVADVNSGQPPTGEVAPDLALAAVRAQDYSAIVFVGGWGSSMYQYAYNDPNLDGVSDDIAVDGQTITAVQAQAGRDLLFAGLDRE